MLGNLQLRILLDSIVSEENAENWWRPELFEKNTRTQLPESLIVREKPPKENDNYNCFVFAFDLQKHNHFLGIAGWEYTKRLGQVVDKLIRSEVLHKLPRPQRGALVVYRTDENVISHIGRIVPNDKVISKWSWGPLLEHGLYDVPASYGDTLEYYTGVESGKEAILLDFSQLHPA